MENELGQIGLAGAEFGTTPCFLSRTGMGCGSGRRLRYVVSPELIYLHNTYRPPKNTDGFNGVAALSGQDHTSRTSLWPFQELFDKNELANFNHHTNRLCIFLEGFLGEGGMSSLKDLLSTAILHASTFSNTGHSDADAFKNNEETAQKNKKTPTEAQRQRRREANRESSARYRQRFYLRHREELRINECNRTADRQAHLKTLELGDETLEAARARHSRTLPPLPDRKSLALKQRQARKKAFIEKHGAQEFARRARAAFRESVMDGTFTWKSSC
ncbi:hypothetical protein B0H14DRAFT_2621618 [Mycena olivaceomarginata]|nr:hypothetical protein B0H14DRAFT_2621618 [Mycena olivaceomarginata]